MKGVRALELSEIWAGPFCGSLMGDMGAEVIKIESIQRIARGPIKTDSPSSDYPNSDPGEQPWNRQSNFNGTNRNKLGITLDLGTPKGVETFKELASISDIIFCNYARRVMEHFGLGYESIKKIKPDIIYMLMPGFGNTGPYKDYRSMGMAIDAILVNHADAGIFGGLHEFSFIAAREAGVGLIETTHLLSESIGFRSVVKAMKSKICGTRIRFLEVPFAYQWV